MRSERNHRIRRNLHVIEHALKLLRELESTFNLEFGEHATLRVVRYRTRVEKALGEVALVVPLKDILLSKEAENGNSLVKDSLNLDIRFLEIAVSQCTPSRRDSVRLSSLASSYRR